ncbi:MAG: lysophospholipid acyltransferase family protein [Casimicrobiaceae bacterium]
MKATGPHNSRLIQCYRWTRTFVHVLEGVTTTVLVFPLSGALTRRSLIKRWSARLLRILAIETRVEGELVSQSGNVLLVANHISWLDIFVLNAVHPVRFVAKSELTRWPVLSQMIRGAGTVFIERARRHDTHRVNAQMAAVLAGGDVVAIFPEGTTTDGRDLLPFKSSLLQPIVEAKGHVQPVAIRYCTREGRLSLAAAWVGDTTFAGSFWSICGAPALVVTLFACPPLPADVSHRRDLARAAEASIRSALASLDCATAPGTAGDHQGATR